MIKDEIRNGDTAIIAEGVGCSPGQVRKTLDGDNGKRPTLLQHNIKKAASLRTKQNKELLEFCQTLQIDAVTLSPTNLLIPE